MNLKRTLFKVILGFILACVLMCLALVAVVFWMADPFNFSAPKDEKLIAIFHAHREAFQKLQQMATEDAQHGLYLDAPYFDEGSKFDKSRQQEYKKLISEIYPSLDATMDGYGDGMRFIFADGGILAIGPGWVKGIEYVPGSSETNRAVYGEREANGATYHEWQGLISTNLDNARSLPADVYLQPIEPNWFIFYQRDDD